MFDVLVAILRGLGLAGAALLLGAGLGHARSAAQVRALLRAHGLVRPVIVPLVARLLGPIEIALGALVLLGGSVGVAVDRPPGTPFGVAVGVAAMASAVLYVLFAAYLLRLLRIRPGSPRGCLGGDEPVSAFSVARAALLAAGCAALGATSSRPLDLVTVATGLLVAVVLWVGVPTARGLSAWG